MRKLTFRKVVLYVFVVSFCLTSIIVNVHSASWSWSRAQGPATSANASNILRDVCMIDSIDGWAVGTEGLIIWWDGTSWKSVPSPTTSQLWSIDMVSSTEGYAVASGSDYPLTESVIRWDGTSWTNMTTPSGTFYSVDMISSTDGWAVGGGSMRWNGTNWSRVEDQINYPLESMKINYPLVMVR
jgi:hypothetical protein